MRRQLAIPFGIFALCSALYVGVLGERAFHPSPDNHFVHLADSFLHGQLSVLGDRPPGNNDWASYGGRWFVSFPPFPAVVIMPAVALWGTAVWDRLFWAIVAGLGPALLYVLLTSLTERGISPRKTWENLLLTGLFAVGSVFFFVAVQGTVWFAAHVLSSALVALYLLFALDARRPFWAGVMLGLTFLTRTTTALLGLLFVCEALRTLRAPASGVPADASAARGGAVRQLARFVAGADLRRVSVALAWFALPVAACVLGQLWMNQARFDHPLRFGHEFLAIRWRGRIETWGLFSYHFLSKNLAIFLAAMPWITHAPPYLKIGGHGLACWVTTPNLLWLLWPKRVDARMVGLYAAASTVLVLNLCYQNSGWLQFGYRFSLDYLGVLIVLLALGGRRFGPLFLLCAALATVVNTFGALTFDRVPDYYDRDGTQGRVFQPD